MQPDQRASFQPLQFCDSVYILFPSSSASTPETWAKFSHDNIYRAERERLASVNLRTLIDNILHDVSEDLRMQCAAVNEAFAKRCLELDDTKQTRASYERSKCHFLNAGYRHDSIF